MNSVVYALPVGRGKRLLGDANRAADKTIWRMATEHDHYIPDSIPFSINASDPGAYESFSMRANELSSPSPSGGKSINQWFNTAAFTQPAFGVYGNSGRNILTQPGINNWDIGLGKTFQFTERGVSSSVSRPSTRLTTRNMASTQPPRLPGGQAKVPWTELLARLILGKLQSARPGRIVQFGGKILF